MLSKKCIVIGEQVIVVFLDFVGYHSNNIYALLTKREVKMAGYCQSSFFAFLWIETNSRSIKTQKKERGQYPAILTEQAWSIKDLLYGFNFKLKLQKRNKTKQNKKLFCSERNSS